MSILKILATVKPTQLPAPKVIFLLTDLPVLRVSDVAYLFDFALRGGHMLLIVPILIADNGSPCHYRLFCVLFWVKILSSQFLLLFQSFILSFPPLPHSASTLAKTIMAVRYMLVSFQTLMSALRILTTEARGKSLVQTPQCRKMHNEI